MRYMLLIYGPEPEMGVDTGAPMPDLAPWLDYGRWLTEKGYFQAGEPLAPSNAATTVRVQNGQRLVTDGPFAETKEVLGGYYIIDAPDLDAAIEAAARCPGALYGSMEVRPIADMAGDAQEGATAGTAAGSSR